MEYYKKGVDNDERNYQKTILYSRHSQLNPLQPYIQAFEGPSICEYFFEPVISPDKDPNWFYNVT